MAIGNRYIGTRRWLVGILLAAIAVAIVGTSFARLSSTLDSPTAPAITQPWQTDSSDAAAVTQPSATASETEASVATNLHSTAPATAPSRDIVPPIDVSPAKRATNSKFLGRPGERYDTANVAMVFESLKARAKAGDLQAARTLFEDLQSCATAPRTSKAHQRAVYELRTRYADDNSPRVVENREFSIAVNDALFAHCNGVTEEHLALRAEFGKQLAAAGDALARQTYLDYAFPSDAGDDVAAALPAFRAQGLAYLDEEVRRGNAAAFWNLGAAYQDPRLNLKDDLRSYTYWYAYAQRRDTNPHDVVYRALANLSETLTPEQRRRAEADAVALYAHCCGG